MQICTPVGAYGGGGYITVLPGTLYTLEAVTCTLMSSSSLGSTMISSYVTSAGTGRVVLSSVATTVITPGTPATYFTATGTYTVGRQSPCLLSSTKGFILYKRVTTGTLVNDTYGVIANISGTTISSFGTPLLIQSGSGSGHGTCLALTPTQILLADPSTGNPSMKVYLLEVSGSTLTVLDSITVSTSGSAATWGNWVKVSNSQAVLSYVAGTTSLRQVSVTVTSGTLSLGTEITADGSVIAGDNGMGLLTASRFVSIRPGSSTTTDGVITSVSGATLTAGSVVQVSGDSGGPLSAGCALPPSQALAVSQTVSGTAVQARIINTDGNTISSVSAATTIASVSGAFNEPDALPIQNNLIAVPALYSNQPKAQILTLT